MAQLQEQLKERFGFEAFREGQEDAISRLLEGKSVLAIFPTGAGKSLEKIFKVRPYIPHLTGYLLRAW